MEWDRKTPAILNRSNAWPAVARMDEPGSIAADDAR